MTGASPTPPSMTPKPQPTTPHRQQIALHQTGCRFIQGLVPAWRGRVIRSVQPGAGGHFLSGGCRSCVLRLQVTRPGGTDVGLRSRQPRPATQLPVASLPLAVGARQTANQNQAAGAEWGYGRLFLVQLCSNSRASLVIENRFGWSYRSPPQRSPYPLRGSKQPPALRSRGAAGFIARVC
jgi:hypothetical protein